MEEFVVYVQAVRSFTRRELMANATKRSYRWALQVVRLFALALVSCAIELYCERSSLHHFDGSMFFLDRTALAIFPPDSSSM